MRETTRFINEEYKKYHRILSKTNNHLDDLRTPEQRIQSLNDKFNSAYDRWTYYYNNVAETKTARDTCKRMLDLCVSWYNSKRAYALREK